MDNLYSILISSLHSEIPGPDFNIDGFYECGTLFYLRVTSQANWEDISDQFIDMEVNACCEIIISLTSRVDPMIRRAEPMEISAELPPITMLS